MVSSVTIKGAVHTGGLVETHGGASPFRVLTTVPVASVAKAETKLVASTHDSELAGSDTVTAAKSVVHDHTLSFIHDSKDLTTVFGGASTIGGGSSTVFSSAGNILHIAASLENSSLIGGSGSNTTIIGGSGHDTIGDFKHGTDHSGITAAAIDHTIKTVESLSDKHAGSLVVLSDKTTIVMYGLDKPHLN
jgi:hypothetical protein